MADTTITLVPGDWTMLPANDVSAISLQNQGGWAVELKATAGTTAPTTRDGARHIRPYAGVAADLTLSQIWPGVSGANRVWAYCDGAVNVAVSYV